MAFVILASQRCCDTWNLSPAVTLLGDKNVESNGSATNITGGVVEAALGEEHLVEVLSSSVRVVSDELSVGTERCLVSDGYCGHMDFWFFFKWLFLQFKRTKSVNILN